MDLANGKPGRDSLPVTAISRAFSATTEALAVNPSALNYGENEGDNLPSVLASWLSKRCSADQKIDERYSNDAKHDAFFITSGVSHSIELVVSALKPESRNKKVVGIERPSYFLAGEIFKANGYEVVGLPMSYTSPTSTSDVFDNLTIDLDATEKLILEGSLVLTFIYAITSNQNPTGSSYSASYKLKLVRFCEKHCIQLIADEVYHLLDFKGSQSRSQRMATFKSPNVISVSRWATCGITLNRVGGDP
tara:strand:+ start:786 stop:1532 length:747 start_codon:yes stop_codon:yes gene_type:complete